MAVQWLAAAQGWSGDPPLVASGRSWGSGTSAIGHPISGTGLNPLSLSQRILHVSGVKSDMALGLMHTLCRFAMYGIQSLRVLNF